MDYVAIIGFLAGIFTTVALIPQVDKAFKTKSTRDVSLVWATTLTLGVGLWLIYGLLINSLPIIIANCVTLVLSFAILILKIKYK